MITSSGPSITLLAVSNGNDNFLGDISIIDGGKENTFN